MRIVAYLGQLLAIYNVWTGFIWSCSLWGTYVNLCCLLFNESEDSNCIVSILEWGSSSGVDIHFNSFWLNMIFRCGADMFCQQRYIKTGLTIIFNGIWTILTLHSSTMPYESNGLTCLLYCREMIMFAGSCWDLINSSFQDCSHLCAVDSQDEVHGASFSCVDCSFWVLHVSDTCGCTIDGHPVVLSFKRDKTVKVTVLAPNYGCHICPLENFVGWTCKNFLWGKQMLATIISLRPLSSFTQTSYESKWDGHGQGLWYLSVLCCAFLCSSDVQRVQAYH